MSPKKKRPVRVHRKASAKSRSASTSPPKRKRGRSTARANEKLRAHRRAPPSSAALPTGREARLVAAAQRYLGYRYRLGGRGTDGTFDCSGLVNRVYQDAGLSISRTASAQARDGRSISLANARPGDVVYFGSPIHHTGIVLENHGGTLKMIHASSSRGVIVTTVTTSSYWRPRLKGARRLTS